MKKKFNKDFSDKLIKSISNKNLIFLKNLAPTKIKKVSSTQIAKFKNLSLKSSDSKEEQMRICLYKKDYKNFLGQYQYSKRPFGAGGFGKVWKAKKIIGIKNGENKYDKNDYVLKRIDYFNNSENWFSAKREVHFGQKLSGEKHISRYVESFDDSEHKIFWLVFFHEGVSIQAKLYTLDANRFVPSKNWTEMKQNDSLVFLVRALSTQLLEAIECCHRKGVLHRDLKPSNILVDKSGVLRISDFGGAVDATATELYDSNGPSKESVSDEYSPPEVFFDDVPFDAADPAAYDMWSLGVVILELLLGTSDVFKLSPREEAILKNKVSFESDDDIEKALKLGAFAEYGIYPPKELVLSGKWDKSLILPRKVLVN
ncbi:hypothetical protein MHBO_000771 [Bonamia ostreae]|uniref:Protein kinase domain-containing protein n=1 Tax=Bonamia ostreae TaxID=126728 RepID=A0ABV2AGQ8_9EUKA